MYTCVYIYMRIYVYMYTYIYMHIYVCIYIYIKTTLAWTNEPGPGRETVSTKTIWKRFDVLA